MYEAGSDSNHVFGVRSFARAVARAVTRTVVRTAVRTVVRTGARTVVWTVVGRRGRTGATSGIDRVFEINPTVAAAAAEPIYH